LPWFGRPSLSIFCHFSVFFYLANSDRRAFAYKFYEEDVEIDYVASNSPEAYNSIFTDPTIDFAIADSSSLSSDLLVRRMFIYIGYFSYYLSFEKIKLENTILIMINYCR
jgi:hypothetical protein